MLLILLHINNTTKFSTKKKDQCIVFLKKDRKKLKPYLSNINIYLLLIDHEYQWISYFRDNFKKKLLIDQINCKTVEEQKFNPD